MTFWRSLFLLVVLSQSSMALSEDATTPAVNSGASVSSAQVQDAIPPEVVQYKTPEDAVGYVDGKVHNLGQLLAMLMTLMGTLRGVAEALNFVAKFTKAKWASTASVGVSTAISSIAWVIGWFGVGTPRSIEKPSISIPLVNKKL